MSEDAGQGGPGPAARPEEGAAPGSAELTAHRPAATAPTVRATASPPSAPARPSPAPSPPAPPSPTTLTVRRVSAEETAPAPRVTDTPAASLSAAGAPPVFAGRYELLRELGRGGMGVLYCAHDRRLGRDVALKLLLVGDRADPEDIARFHREARAAAALAHPGIVSVLDVGEAEGKSYYVMELVPGRSLKDAIQAGAVGPREAAECTRQVAEALQFAHTRGVLHRDIKPQNTLLQPNAAAGPTPPPGHAAAGHETAKLVDFGLAKFAEHQVQMPAANEGAAGRSLRTLTRAGEILGTPSYMSPEQIQGAATVTASTDIYSLGATLFEMITGHPPFHDAPTLAELMRRIHMDDPIRPRRAVPDLDADLETICLKCLAKEPRDRYAAAGDLAEDCRRWLADEPIAARPVGTIARLWKRAKRNRAVALPLAVAAVTVLGVAGYLAGEALARRARIAFLRHAVVRALDAQAADQGEAYAVELAHLAPDDGDALRLYRRVKSALALARGNAAWTAYVSLRAELVAARRDLENVLRDAAKAQTQAAKAPLWALEDRTRALERARGEVFATAISTCGEAAGYWKEEETSPEREAARERLGDLYWDRYLEAEAVRNHPEEGTYGTLVRTYAEAKYVALLRCEQRVSVTFLLPRGFPGGSGAAPVHAWLYRYERDHRGPVLVPQPCDPRSGEPVKSVLLPPADPVPWPVVDAAAAATPGADGTGTPASPPAPRAGGPGKEGGPDDDAVRAIERARWTSIYRLVRLPQNHVRLAVVVPDPGPGGAAGTPVPGPRRPQGLEVPDDGAAARPRLVLELRLPRGSYLLMQASRPEMRLEPVGLFPIDEGPFGVRDLGGGVREWTATSTGTAAEYQIVKGGCVGTSAELCRSAGRNLERPILLNPLQGFRLAAHRTP